MVGCLQIGFQKMYAINLEGKEQLFKCLMKKPALLPSLKDWSGIL